MQLGDRVGIVEGRFPDQQHRPTITHDPIVASLPSWGECAPGLNRLAESRRRSEAQTGSHTRSCGTPGSSIAAGEHRVP